MQPTRVFTAALGLVVLAWAVFATALVSLIAWLDVGLLREAIVISLLNGLIAVISFAPGLVREWLPYLDPAEHARKIAQDANGKDNYIGSLFGGMILRLIATVALFVLCRYQMAAPLHWIAAMIIGWYVVMTTTEVFILAKRLPRTDTLGAIATTAVAAPLSVNA